jgi:uncharacterized membrane protein
MLTVLFIFTCLLLIGISVPLIKRRVRPNVWYGFRTPKTLSNEPIWYDANEFCGRMLLLAGLATLLGVLLLAFIPMPLAARAFADAGVMLVSVLCATAASLAYLQRL